MCLGGERRSIMIKEKHGTELKLEWHTKCKYCVTMYFAQILILLNLIMLPIYKLPCLYMCWKTFQVYTDSFLLLRQIIIQILHNLWPPPVSNFWFHTLQMQHCLHDGSTYKSLYTHKNHTFCNINIYMWMNKAEGVQTFHKTSLSFYNHKNSVYNKTTVVSLFEKTTSMLFPEFTNTKISVLLKGIKIDT